MLESVKVIYKKVGLPRIIITVLFLTICLAAYFLGLKMDSLASDILRRFGMFGILTLAMVPSIQCGTGPNFALPIGIVCGLLASVITLEFGFTDIERLGYGLIPAILIAIPMSGLAGYVYSIMLNKIKGSEMLVATFTGFSIVQFFCILWVILPVRHPEMLFPIGDGIRQTVALESTFGYFLNDLWSFPLYGIKIPTGLLLFFFFNCLILWLFTQSKTGIALKAAGDNPKFAAASGISNDKYRIIGVVLSTILGAVGIIVYCSSYGFMQLYTGPLFMAFPAVAAVLIGGASANKAKISHAIIGVFLFQGLLTVALPVANAIFSQGNLSEILRMIVQNGIILYALTKVGGES